MKQIHLRGVFVCGLNAGFDHTLVSKGRRLWTYFHLHLSTVAVVSFALLCEEKTSKKLRVIESTRMYVNGFLQLLQSWWWLRSWEGGAEGVTLLVNHICH